MDLTMIGQGTRALVFAMTAWLGLSVAASQAAEPLRQDGVWAQTYSDMQADPAVRFGRLPNGMRYAIRRNQTPAKHASIRFRIGSGSFEETEAQRGLAHVLEHMAFKGSTHIPGGEMIRILQRLGLSFGPDQNASTEHQQTLYTLDLPVTEPSSLDTALMVMRERATELTLDPKALETERGVVLSEERLRDTPDYRSMTAELAFVLKGQLAPKRWPIGLVDVVKHAPAAEVADYYHRNYRPERATLIVVGDIDPDRIESEIRKRFSDWKDSDLAFHTPDVGALAPRGMEAHVTVQPGAGTSIKILWVKPFDATADTNARERRDLIALLAAKVLTTRLERVASLPNPPFVRAEVPSENLNVLQSAKVAGLDIIAQEGHWREGLLAAEAIRRQAVAFGIGQDELDAAIAEWRTIFLAKVASEATQRNAEIATLLVEAVDQEGVFTSPSQDLVLYDAFTKGLSAKEVSHVVATDFSGQGPIVSLVSPQPVAGGEAELTKVFAAAEAQPVTAIAASAALAWPYTNFGTPGTIADTKTIADLGVTFIRFANGVRLTVRPSRIIQDQVLVSVGFGGGYQGLPRDVPSPTWALSAFVTGGLKALPFDDLQQVLADKDVHTGLKMEEDAFLLEGSTRPPDLPTQMQVLAAFMQAPAFRPETFERIRQTYLDKLDGLDATPQGVDLRHHDELTHGGDIRWHFPTRAELRATKPADLQAMLEPALRSGPIEVVITGDVTIEAATKAVAATFGAFNARPDPAASSDAARHVTFAAPTSSPIVFTHNGRIDQGFAYVGWPTVDAIGDFHLARKVGTTESVLLNRVIDQLRIAEGSTYAPDSDIVQSTVFPHFGFLLIGVEIPPVKMDGFFTTLSKITSAMAADGVTADELQRAKTPLLEDVIKQLDTNDYWLEVLRGAQTAPWHMDLARTKLADYQSISADDVRFIAKTYLTDAKAWRMEVRSAAK